MFIFLVKLITNLWFTQISKNSNFNYSNLKTNGTNRKFIIFLKLMALTETLQFFWPKRKKELQNKAKNERK